MLIWAQLPSSAKPAQSDTMVSPAASLKEGEPLYTWSPTARLLKSSLIVHACAGAAANITKAEVKATSIFLVQDMNLQ